MKEKRKSKKNASKGHLGELREKRFLKMKRKMQLSTHVWSEKNASMQRKLHAIKFKKKFGNKNATKNADAGGKKRMQAANKICKR